MNTAIRSDDPEAREKLLAKRTTLESRRAQYKAINAIIRRHKKAGKAAQIAALVQDGHQESTAAQLVEPDFAGRVGIPAYELTNLGAQIRQVTKRLDVLEAQAQCTTEEAEVNGVTVRKDLEAHRVMLFFPDKPDPEVRSDLKAHGFRWARSIGAWQRHYSEAAIHHADRIAAACC